MFVQWSTIRGDDMKVTATDASGASADVLAYLRDRHGNIVWATESSDTQFTIPAEVTATLTDDEYELITVIDGVHTLQARLRCYEPFTQPPEGDEDHDQ